MLARRIAKHKIITQHKIDRQNKVGHVKEAEAQLAIREGKDCFWSLLTGASGKQEKQETLIF